MLRARKSGVLTPVIYNVEHEAATIYMEHVEGSSVRDLLLSGSLSSAGRMLKGLLVPPCVARLLLK